MPGRTPAEAVVDYRDPIQRAVDCVVPTVVNIRGGYHPSDRPHSLILGDGSPQRLRGTRIVISLSHLYRVMLLEDPDDPRGSWGVNTVGYMYALCEREGPEILSYHWHPFREGEFTLPHLHLGAGAGIGRPELVAAHLPTGRIAIEDFLRLVLRDFGATPRRSDWEAVLSETQAALER